MMIKTFSAAVYKIKPVALVRVTESAELNKT